MKKSTFLAAAVFTTIAIVSFATSASAQNEYRISQPIPDTINDVVVGAGWNVRIRHADQSAVTIITPCSVFFDEGNEPQISTVKGRTLTLLPNNSMPKSTIVEITLRHKLFCLTFEKNATAETENLVFYAKNANVYIKEGATVTGTSWKAEKNLDVEVRYDAKLKLDTLLAADYLEAGRSAGATLECPVLIGSKVEMDNDIKSFGTLYQSDASKNLVVKNRNLGWTRYVDGFSLSIGLTSPIPLYMNNKSGSPYNRGESYRISMYAGFLKPLRLADNFSFRPWLALDLDWSRLLNSVSYDGNALQLNTPVSGEIPQQHLYGESLGLKLQFSYSFGNRDSETGAKNSYVNFGLDAMYNFGGRLVTRTMGSDNRWNRTREKVDIFNPWQLRAFVSLGNSKLLRGSVGLTYDLLPTFRTGTDTDKLHTFGVTLRF